MNGKEKAVSSNSDSSSNLNSQTHPPTPLPPSSLPPSLNRSESLAHSSLEVSNRRIAWLHHTLDQLKWKSPPFFSDLYVHCTAVGYRGRLHIPWTESLRAHLRKFVLSPPSPWRFYYLKKLIGEGNGMYYSLPHPRYPLICSDKGMIDYMKGRKKNFDYFDRDSFIVHIQKYFQQFYEVERDVRNRGEGMEEEWGEEERLRKEGEEKVERRQRERQQRINVKKKEKRKRKRVVPEKRKRREEDERKTKRARMANEKDKEKRMREKIEIQDRSIREWNKDYVPEVVVIPSPSSSSSPSFNSPHLLSPQSLNSFPTTSLSSSSSLSPFLTPHSPMFASQSSFSSFPFNSPSSFSFPLSPRFDFSSPSSSSSLTANQSLNTLVISSSSSSSSSTTSPRSRSPTPPSLSSLFLHSPIRDCDTEIRNSSRKRKGRKKSSNMMEKAGEKAVELDRSSDRREGNRASQNLHQLGPSPPSPSPSSASSPSPSSAPSPSYPHTVTLSFQPSMMSSLPSIFPSLSSPSLSSQTNLLPLSSSFASPSSHSSSIPSLPPPPPSLSLHPHEYVLHSIALYQKVSTHIWSGCYDNQISTIHNLIQTYLDAASSSFCPSHLLSPHDVCFHILHLMKEMQALEGLTDPLAARILGVGAMVLERYTDAVKSHCK